MWLTIGSSTFRATCLLLFPAGLTLVDTRLEFKQLPLPYFLTLYNLSSSKMYPHLPLPGASARFGGNCADEEILVAAAEA